MQVGGNSSLDPDVWAGWVVAVAQRRDHDAFEKLFRHFAPRVKTYMLRSGSEEAVAEELAHETLMMVWRKAGSFDPARSGAGGWIFAIARNLRIDAYRRQRRGGAINVSEIEAEFEVDTSAAPDEALAMSQSEHRVRAALSNLPADQMRVIELSFFQDMAHPDIAKTLEIPLGTVKSRLRLAINRLRNLLGQST